MASNKKKRVDPFAPEVVEARRSFPKGKTIALCIMVLVQVVLILFAVFYDPQPQDRIDYYEIIAEPKPDGTVDLTYTFVWTALDSSEELTWVDIGMANSRFVLDKYSFSSNIKSAERYTDGDYVSARLRFKRGYKGGETLTFSFKVNQAGLLCKDEGGYFYEFVPGWFNATPVKSYCFIWRDSPEPISVNTNAQKDGSPAWKGSLPCGSYVKMKLRYDQSAFSGASTVRYEEFYDGDVYDELEGDKVALVVLSVIVTVVLLCFEIYMIDSVVSYHRGRGFLHGYGHYVHHYGRINPSYESEKAKHEAKSGGRGGRGGGCACACACACAGGGRAGCSQKDTVAFPIKITSSPSDK